MDFTVINSPQILTAHPKCGPRIGVDGKEPLGTPLISKATQCEGTLLISKYPLFKIYCLSGLCCLGPKPLKDTNLHGIWKKVQPFADLGSQNGVI
ncbi:hypothetical protein RchiOBHm_Chr6g0273061 [Rosa chinensis]|uniref:Uncharacterized protein n=1 Tax=Rosa chinensis TaxID=74649 RepID=A0A2P6PRD3_ROSCH|nr:hypothetical protein RchiOBHm_Chr6g0273061 [Rosa chinensis]